MNTFQRRLSIGLLALCSLFFCGADGRGVVTVQDDTGQTVRLYAESHALLIGISHYTNGWNDLRSVPGELEEVRAVLAEQGFDVTLRLNLDAAKLRSEIVAFIDRHGRAPQNRLLFFFSGHGHTLTKAYGDQLGYIVPADAPLPITDRQGFLSKAVSMDQMLTWARDIDAKHALFAFDSCFAGSIFEQPMRGEREPPPALILEQTSLPVRMFITAGRAGDPVPAKSTFTPSFVDALRGRKGDLDHDGYVTGMELGFYLQGEVRKFVAQTPQYGKIREINLARGDFVFAVGPRPSVRQAAAAPPPAAAAPAADAPERAPTGRQEAKQDSPLQPELFSRLTLRAVPGEWLNFGVGSRTNIGGRVGPAAAWRRPAFVPERIESLEIRILDTYTDGSSFAFYEDASCTSRRARAWNDEAADVNCSSQAALWDRAGKLLWQIPLHPLLSRKDHLEIDDIRLVDGVLYFNEACQSYPREARGNCSSLVALDPLRGKVLWRSESLVSNDVFVVLDDYILARYGFSYEAAFIRLVRRTDGSVAARAAVPSAPNTLEVESDGRVMASADRKAYRFQAAISTSKAVRLTQVGEPTPISLEKVPADPAAPQAGALDRVEQALSAIPGIDFVRNGEAVLVAGKAPSFESGSASLRADAEIRLKSLASAILESSRGGEKLSVHFHLSNTKADMKVDEESRTEDQGKGDPEARRFLLLIERGILMEHFFGELGVESNFSRHRDIVTSGDLEIEISTLPPRSSS